MSLVAHLVAIPSFAPQLASMIGLGVGIDYALLLVTRHREHLAQGMAVDEAAARSVATAGRAVVFAGGTVVIAILGLIVAGIPFLTAAGIGISVVVLVMVLASITLLPAFLALAGPRIGGRRTTSGAPSMARSMKRPASTGVAICSAIVAAMIAASNSSDRWWGRRYRRKKVKVDVTERRLQMANGTRKTPEPGGHEGCAKPD